jgi:chromosome segregation ATPase
MEGVGGSHPLVHTGLMRVVHSLYMTAKETTLDTILSTTERGFAAVAADISEMKGEITEIKGDITEIKSAMATKEDVRTIINEELTPIHAELRSIRDELDNLSESSRTYPGSEKRSITRLSVLPRSSGI